MGGRAALHRALAASGSRAISPLRARQHRLGLVHADARRG